MADKKIKQRFIIKLENLLSDFYDETKLPEKTMDTLFEEYTQKIIKMVVRQCRKAQRDKVVKCLS
jgi:hypothetical protein